MTRKCRAKNPATCRVHGDASFDGFFNTHTPAEVKHNRKEPRVIMFDVVHHVGSLQAQDVKKDSYEGAGLSVSINPDEWQKIARLSGVVHTLRKRLTMLDYHGLTRKQVEEIRSYAVERKYAVESIRYKVSYYDDEWDDTFVSYYDSFEEAENEALEDSDIEEVKALVATDRFPDYTVAPGDGDLEEKMAAVWVDEQKPQLDGVWWADRLDVNRLSAPRGVIVPSKIAACLPLFTADDK
jgi:hypothetical protein